MKLYFPTVELASEAAQQAHEYMIATFESYAASSAAGQTTCYANPQEDENGVYINVEPPVYALFGVNEE